MPADYLSFRSIPTVLAAVLLCASAYAADDAPQKEIEARYRSERAACENAQDKAACLREAAAARAEARRGTLAGTQETYEQNALARCAALPEAERDSCARRVRGEGETHGSVSEGGILREYRELTLPSRRAPADEKAQGR